MGSIVEEKIIDGVRTEFRYERNLLGMKGNLSSKYEYIGNKKNEYRHNDYERP